MIKIQNPLIARFARGLGANGITQVSQLIMRLAEIPILIYFWGAEGYGEWLMILALPSILVLSDVGITKTAQREMIMHTSRGDNEGALRIFQSSWCALIFLSLCVVGTITTITLLTPLNYWLKLKSISQGQLAGTILLLSSQVLLTFQSSLLRGVFSAQGSYAKGEILQNSLSIFSFLAMIAVVFLGGDIVDAALGLALGTLVGFLLMWFSVYRFRSFFHYGSKHFSFNEIKKLSYPSLANLAFPLSDAINMQGVRLLVGIILGPTTLAVFTSLRTLCRMALQPVLAIARTVEPEIALAYGVGDTEKVNKLLLHSSQMTIWLSILLCLFVTIAGETMYKIWTSNVLLFDYGIFIPLMLASFVSSCWNTALMVPCATNRHRKLAVIYLFTQGIGCIGTLSLLTLWLGKSGPAVSLLISEVITCLVVMKVTTTLTGLPISRWLGFALTPPTRHLQCFIKPPQKNNSL